LLLHCTRKKKKPPHYQLPGGHVDKYEFEQVATKSSNVVSQGELYRAARLGCAREVFEETGLDFRNRLEELLPLVLYSTKEDNKLINEYKSRIFFVCEVRDEDFASAVRINTKSFPFLFQVLSPFIPTTFFDKIYFLSLSVSIHHHNST
jgi:8-oxo-dGTP pyrophosphatase MutT (NUDIX family)